MNATLLATMVPGLASSIDRDLYIRPALLRFGWDAERCVGMCPDGGQTTSDTTPSLKAGSDGIRNDDVEAGSRLRRQ